MSVPEIVHSTLDGEDIATRVSLGGDDELFITPSRTIVYRADGLLSDESVDEFPHATDRLTLSEGRRKTTFTLEYALDGTRSFTVPSSKTDAIVHPLLAGILRGNGITTAGETIHRTYRFSELTLVITSDRLVKHIGEAVWDGEYEEYHFDDVTSLAFEDGSVATSIVLTVDGRPERIKAPNDQAEECKERLKRALFEYHDVDSLAELNDVLGVDDESEDNGDGGSSVDFGEGVDPLDANPPALDDRTAEEPASSRGGDTAAEGGKRSDDPLATDDPIPDSVDATRSREQREESTVQSASHAAPGTEHTAEVAETGELFTESTDHANEETDADPRPTPVADPAPELLDRLDALEAAVDRQSERIDAQQETIEQLIEELRRGR